MNHQIGTTEMPATVCDQIGSGRTTSPKAARGISRRFKLLERMGCFNPLPDNIEIMQASTAEDLSEAYRLIHDLFVSEMYILPQPAGVRIRLFEALPDTATFVAKQDGKIISVISVVIDSQAGLPSDKVFGEEIDQLRDKGRRLCEGTNWAVLPEYRKSPAMTELMRCIFAYATAHQCNDILADICPGHKAFYELMAFEAIGSERSSSSDLDDPVVLVRLPIKESVQSVYDLDDKDNDLAQVGSFYLEKNRYHKVMKSWNQTAQERFFDPQFLRELFVLRSNFLFRCNPKEKTIIERRWGKNLFQQVWDSNIIHYSKRAICA